jgi:putative endonuclease
LAVPGSVSIDRFHFPRYDPAAMARTPRRELGDRGEDLAFEHLARLGYRILERNVRSGRHDELDGVALDGRTICFIEVKSASADSAVDPEEHLTPRKIRALRRAARRYLLAHRIDEDAAESRFDVVAVRLDGERAAVKVYKSAF